MSNVLCNPREYGFAADFAEPYFLFTDDVQLKAHADYREAKAGNQVVALNFVWNLTV